MIEALRFNTWFSSLIITQPTEGRKLKESVAVKVSDILRDNDCIRSLTLNGIGNSSSFVIIAKNLSQNTAVTSIDVSQTNVEDKGLTALANDCFASWHAITSLNLSHCGAGNSGFS